VYGEGVQDAERSGEEHHKEIRQEICLSIEKTNSMFRIQKIPLIIPSLLCEIDNNSKNLSL